MKVFLNDLEIKEVYNLNWRSDPIVSFYAYPEILPEILKHSKGKLTGSVDDEVWLAEMPFNKLCDDDNQIVWEYIK